MIAAICQPEHLPWLGWFDKSIHADHLILLDNVQFKKRYFDNRNKIRTAQGWSWLTVPVFTRGRFTQLICEVEIDADRPWQADHWKAVQYSYANAPHFDRIAPFLEELYTRKKWRRLSELNTALIRWGLETLDLNPRLHIASELGVEGKSSELLARLCEKIGADQYLSGISGKDYIDEGEFSSRGIKVVYQDFHHPIYTQMHGEFEPCMSFIDLAANHGPEAGSMLKNPAGRMEHVFL